MFQFHVGKDGVMRNITVNLDGKPVERSKFDHPYSYDEFTVWSSDDFYKVKSSKVYSDRLMQWDYDKFNNSCMKAFGDTGQMFYSRNPEAIEEFLKEYMGKEIKLTGIVEGCNRGNGYPYWAFYYYEV